MVKTNELYFVDTQVVRIQHFKNSCRVLGKKMLENIFQLWNKIILRNDKNTGLKVSYFYPQVIYIYIYIYIYMLIKARWYIHIYIYICVCVCVCVCVCMCVCMCVMCVYAYIITLWCLSGKVDKPRHGKRI